MAKPNLIWIFDEEPKTHVEQREWPCAVYSGAAKKMAAYIVCESRYNRGRLNEGNHLPMKVVIYDYSKNDSSGKRRLCNQWLRNFNEVTTFVEQHLSNNPGWQPMIV